MSLETTGLRGVNATTETTMASNARLTAASAKRARGERI
jgi:hypothetical protein